MNEIPRDHQIRIELAREAKDFVENRAVQASLEVLRLQWNGELLTDGIDMSRVYELRANLMALDRFAKILRNLMTPQQRASNVRQSG